MLDIQHSTRVPYARHTDKDFVVKKRKQPKPLVAQKFFVVGAISLFDGREGEFVQVHDLLEQYVVR